MQKLIFETSLNNIFGQDIKLVKWHAGPEKN